ncbi:MAG: hypothetical protein IPN34_23685 [Planctomycetes bacterium]|nr:hypothetical protein [Planctomycetota bacterium]
MKRARRRIAAAALGLVLGLGATELLTRVAFEPQAREVLELVPSERGALLAARRDAGAEGQRLQRLRPVPPIAEGGPVQIGVFGSSTALGMPFAPPLSIWHWLERELEQGHPGIDLELYCFARAGASLRQMAAIAREVPPGYLHAAIVLGGNNEFLAEHVESGLRTPPPSAWVAALEPLRFLRSVDLLCELLVEARELDVAPRATPLEYVLDEPGAFAQRERLIEHATASLERLVRTLRRRATRVLVVLPAGDLWGAAPSMSTFRDERTRDERDRCRWQLAAAFRALDAKDGASCLQLCAEILALAPEIAHAHGLVARVEIARGQTESARAALSRAQELDVRPAWLAAPLRRALQVKLRELACPSVDVQPLHDALGTPELTAPLFVDHCHPSIAGQQLIAGAVARAIDELQWLGPPPAPRVLLRLSAEELARAATAEAEALSLAAHLSFLAQAERELPRYTARALRDRLAALAEIESPTRWAMQLELALIRGWLGEDEAARGALQDAIASSARARAFLVDLLPRSVRLRGLIERLGLALPAGGAR